ncbi:L-aspartate oxidase [Arthrobacter glacialis]|uniref:L-aspartate oxidase n=1 Tax=Arthrobacter glacialis TaxID=1664 RepID=UPI000CD40539|nr:FAD-dependent oxidoreductase [Arthrobacter glacialis]POH59826.1 L-aspartate oxidase [Arthrobacter glacialis]
MTARNSHLVVVGSGIAGLYSALLAAEAGLRVTLLTKGKLAHSNTHFAQGGICAVLSPGEAAPGDSVAAHIADTLKAGAGQCDLEAVRILCSEAASDIAALERFGVAFDRDPETGRRALGLEGAHSAARILHAGGDATGAAIADGLIRAVLDAAALGTLTIEEDAFLQELLVRQGRVTGVLFRRSREAADSVTLPADAVLLATGGAGQLFEFTTNPEVATADGVAAAWRAGALLADLEYFQFHPTALAVGKNFLISEAVRGAGAVLRDASGEAFMLSFHPDGELAPRDVVSRSIAAHLARSSEGAASADSPRTVFLDATAVEKLHGAGYLAKRFPTIDAMTGALGFDWSREWLPVAPAAHYWMGGVATNLNAQTSLPGLYAAGEVACTGVHGANRLASNSLLEGLVFGRRGVAAFLAETHDAETQGAEAQDAHPLAASWPELPVTGTVRPGVLEPTATKKPTAPAAEPFSRLALRSLMSGHVGVVRDGAGLRHAQAVLANWRSQSLGEGIAGTSAEAAESRNLLLVAELLVHAALAREESVGAHCRSDHPGGDQGTRASRFWINTNSCPATEQTTSLAELESESV